VGLATIVEALVLAGAGYFTLRWLSQPEARPRTARRVAEPSSEQAS
jgi:hypothetical protein